MGRFAHTVALSLLLSALVLGGVGCRGLRNPPPVATVDTTHLPRELDKVTHPVYRVEPPDVLLVEAYKGVPKPPHKLEPLDVLTLALSNPVPGEPLQGLFTVDLEGNIDLGPIYGGKLRVTGMTTSEAKAEVEKFLATASKLVEPKVAIGIAQTRSVQRVSGPHLVRSDGTIGLGSYGNVSVVGLTLVETKEAIEKHLSNELLDPGVSVEVAGFNSKVIYVIQDGGGAGQTVLRLPCTGNETVLDAIAQVNGLSQVASTDRIWVARPAPVGSPPQILPVKWEAVVSGGETATNYQLLPGDRVYVASLPMVRLNTMLTRAVAPIERLLGVILLGNGTYRGVAGLPLAGIN